jgi:hypothetical protein
MYNVSVVAYREMLYWGLTVQTCFIITLQDRTIIQRKILNPSNVIKLKYLGTKIIMQNCNNEAIRRKLNLGNVFYPNH